MKDKYKFLVRWLVGSTVLLWLNLNIWWNVNIFIIFMLDIPVYSIVYFMVGIIIDYIRTRWLIY